MAAWNIPAPKSKYTSIFLDKIIGIPPCLKNGIWGFRDRVYAGEQKLLQFYNSIGGGLKGLKIGPSGWKISGSILEAKQRNIGTFREILSKRLQGL